MRAYLMCFYTFLLLYNSQSLSKEIDEEKKSIVT